jgi:hypothetical protein
MSLYSINALQGAAILAAHATFTKMLLSFTFRVYQYLEPDKKRKAEMESSPTLKEFQKAQLNESEYAALLMVLLIFLSSVNGDEASNAATLSVVGQVGYVWSRTVIGFPKLPTITFAVIRYGGLFLATAELLKLAFALP